MHIVHDHGMKTLASYLSEAGMSQKEFGALIGKDQSLVSRYAAGECTPDLDTLVRIERATNGAVPVLSWAKDASS